MARNKKVDTEKREPRTPARKAIEEAAEEGNLLSGFRPEGAIGELIRRVAAGERVIIRDGKVVILEDQ